MRGLSTSDVQGWWKEPALSVAFISVNLFFLETPSANVYNTQKRFNDFSFKDPLEDGGFSPVTPLQEA